MTEIHTDTAHDAAPEHASHVGHVAPMKILLGVFLGLLVLTWLTVAVTYVDLGKFNLYVALAVAFVKATLVVLYFMHLRWDKGINVVVFVGCLLFVSLFIALALTDTRQYAASKMTGEAPGMEKIHKPLGTEAK